MLKSANWNIKERFSIIFSLFFSGLLAIVLLIILTRFSQFRKEEFTQRLVEKAETTVKLLINVKEVDYQLLKIIDKNTIYKLYNEKTLIFDEDLNLIYSSIDDTKLEWNIEDLKEIKTQKTTYEKIGKYDVVGLSYRYANKDYYALISAEDRYGQNKLTYLKLLLLIAFVLGVTGVWFLSFYLSKKALLPLDSVSHQIREITEKNLYNRLSSSSNKNDEINSLVKSFNDMIGKIEHSYKSQKDFTGNASHELRTPLARIITQIENSTRSGEIDEKNTLVLKSVIADCYQLSDVVSSLLLLSRLNNEEKISFKTIRLDEIIFECVSNVQKQYPTFKIQFEVNNLTENEFLFNVKGDDTLLSIAIINLLKNAYFYSDNQQAEIKVTQTEKHLQLDISNSGETPKNDLKDLFNTFKRGNNSINKPGSGLGLGIVKRIITYHRASISYTTPNTNTNLLSILFKI